MFSLSGPLSQPVLGKNAPAVFATEIPSPAPTSGPLPITNNANLSQSYSGGGGGGSVGPNIVCSTITTNSGFVTFGDPVDIQSNGNLAIGGDGCVSVSVVGSTLTAVGIIGGNLQGIQLDGGQMSQNAIQLQSGLTNPDTNDMYLNISTAQDYFGNLFLADQPPTYLEIQSDATAGQSTCGAIAMGALPDGRSFVGAALGYSVSSLSTLMLIADGVNMSSLNVSTINGATYPPPAEPVPPNIVVSTIGVGESSGLSIAGFPQPLILYGATNLNAGGSTIVGLDRSYTIPYYQFVNYRNSLPATASTLYTSTINNSDFAIYGEANQQVQYMVVGN
jgi:hypothetical protein